MKAKDYLKKLDGYDFTKPDHLPLILGDLHDMQLELLKELGDTSAVQAVVSLTEFPFLADVKKLQVGE